MEKVLPLALLLCCGMVCPASNTKAGYRTATIVNVVSFDDEPQMSGYENPTDAPLTTEVYGYDLGIRLDCTVYSLRYQSPIDYLPSVFAPEREVQAFVRKPFMYVAVPGQGDFKLAITGHRKSKDSACMAAN